MIRWIAMVPFIVAGCGSVTGSQQHDAGAHDDALTSPDAAVDAAPLREAREIVVAGGRMTGATYTFDIQIGHGVSQDRITGPIYKLEGNAAVKP